MNHVTRKLGLLSALGVVLALAPAAAMAQTSQSVGLDFTTADTLVLQNSTGTVDMGAAVAADFDNGYVDNAATPDHTLNVAANTTWQVAVKGDTDETGEAWLKTGGDCPTAAKAVGTIKYSQDAFGTAGVALTASNVVVSTGNATAETEIDIDYRVDVSWTVDTGACIYDYNSVVYTLSAV